MMLDKVAAAFAGADALRAALAASAGETPTVIVHPHVICSTTQQAETLVSAIAEAMDYEQITGPEVSPHAVVWSVGDVTVSGLLSDAQKDRLTAAQCVCAERTLSVVLGDE